MSDGGSVPASLMSDLDASSEALPAETSAASNSYALPMASSPDSARLSMDSPADGPLLQPASVDIVEPRHPGINGAPKVASSPSQSRIREVKERSSPSGPRRRVSGLARPPLEGRWLQRFEACHAASSERPASATSSTRGASSPGSSRSDPVPHRILRAGDAAQDHQRRPTPSKITRAEVASRSRAKADSYDKLEEEVLSMMSALQRPRDVPQLWDPSKPSVPRAGQTNGRLRSPSPRDPRLRTADRAAARLSTDGGVSVSLSARARQSAGYPVHGRSSRQVLTQKAAAPQRSRMKSGPARTNSLERTRLPESSNHKSAESMEGLMRLSHALGEAQRALELQTEALRCPQQSDLQISKDFELFAGKLQRQLAEAQSTSRALGDYIAKRPSPRATARMPDEPQAARPEEAHQRLLNGNHITSMPIPEEAEECTDEKSRLAHVQDYPEQAEECADEKSRLAHVQDYPEQAVQGSGGGGGGGDVAGGDSVRAISGSCGSELDRVESMDKAAPLESAAEAEPLGQGNASSLSSPPADEVRREDEMSDHLWEFVVQGQVPGDETADTLRKTVTCFPGDAMSRLAACNVACVCARGHRVDPTVPNQDDLVLAMCSWGDQGSVALYGVFDGHGPAGHRCAAIARGFLPERIFGDPDLLVNPPEVLKSAFAEAQQDMLRQVPTDAYSSGTTATIALVLRGGVQAERDQSSKAGIGPGTTVHTAHVGDSRAILARLSDAAKGGKCFIVKELTKDHRPDDEGEAQRIKDAGGHICLGGGKRARVICESVPGHPGFALTRSLGLAIGRDCGISAEPQVFSHHMPADAEALLILGTDGLFEFCGNRTVAGHLLKHGVTERALEEVVHEAMKLWSANSSNSTVDDATAIAASLGRVEGDNK
ncbi:unnamed protein product [Symbiodinium microadriaticum]|nr:unnamed protein product [Symbiodinium microadriaticum]